jgi:hypothetical protein
MKKVKLNIQKAIINKNLIEFAYTDKSKDKSGVRIIEPYLFGVDKKGSYFASGYDTDESASPKYRHKNYLLQQMDLLSVEILKDVYTYLKIEPDKIYKTKETIIICVVDFPGLIEKYFLEIIFRFEAWFFTNRKLCTNVIAYGQQYKYKKIFFIIHRK